MITDFSMAQSDARVLSETIWRSATLTEQQVVSTYAKVMAGGVMLDFGADRVLFAGLTTTSGLVIFLDII